MRVLITGASGFIGRNVVRALLANAHEVVGVGRSAQTPHDLPLQYWIVADFAKTPPVDFWRAHLMGVDVVINAVGIIRETRSQTFDALHTVAPIALFQACAAAGVTRVIQLSALGADEQARSAYHRSKKAADDALRRLPLRSVIVQPSLVFGPGGASARLFSGLAALPVVPLIGNGRQQVQPIHIDDLAAGILMLVDAAEAPQCIAFVGPEPTTMQRFLFDLRRALGLRPTHALHVPSLFIRAAATIGEYFPRALLTRATLAMLERGNVAAADALTALLGRAPWAPCAFLAATADARHRARNFFLVPLFRFALGFVWLWSGWVSLFAYPRAASENLLGQVGLTGELATAVLYVAALSDIALGVMVLTLRRAWIWPLQIVLMLGYSAIVAWYLPAFWFHPFGPLIKNVVLLAAMMFLWLWDKDAECTP